MLQETAQFFVLREGKYEGPLSRSKLEEMLGSGEVKRTDLAFREGLSNWMPVVAVLAARTTPPPFIPSERVPSAQPPHDLNGLQPSSTPSPASMPKRKSEEIGNARLEPPFPTSVQSSKAIDWSLISPFTGIRFEKLWLIPWMRWFLFFATMPWMLGALARASSWSSASQDFSLATYFAVLWAWGLRFVVKPERVALWSTLLAGFGVFAIWTVCMVVLSKVSSLDALNNALNSPDFARRILPSILFSLIKIAVVLLPFYWSIHKQRRETQNTHLYGGLLVGLVFGIRMPLLAVLADSSITLKSALPVDVSAAISPLAIICELVFYSLLLATVGCCLAMGLRSHTHRVPLTLGVACCCGLVMALNSFAPFAFGGLAALGLLVAAFIAWTFRTGQVNASVVNSATNAET